MAVGPIKDALVEAARKLEADVVGIGKESGARRQRPLAGPYLVRDPNCPVLSV